MMIMILRLTLLLVALFPAQLVNAQASNSMEEGGNTTVSSSIYDQESNNNVDDITPPGPEDILWMDILMSLVAFNAAICFLCNAIFWRPLWESRFKTYQEGSIPVLGDCHNVEKILKPEIHEFSWDPTEDNIDGDNDEEAPSGPSEHKRRNIQSYKFLVTFTINGIHAEKQMVIPANRGRSFKEKDAVPLLVLPDGQPSSAILVDDVLHELSPHVGADSLYIWLGYYGGTPAWSWCVLLLLVAVTLPTWTLFALSRTYEISSHTLLFAVLSGSRFMALLVCNTVCLVTASIYTRDAFRGYPHDFEVMLGTVVTRRRSRVQ